MSSDGTRFARPPPTRPDLATPILYVANCGPAVGTSHADVASAFATFGEVVGVHAADDSGARVIVCFADTASARAALEAWDGKPSCSRFGGQVLHIRYSVAQRPRKINDSVSVYSDASKLGIPGIYLLHDFVSRDEEQILLAEVDANPWKSLAKRRVQHYGYEFLYETRNVDSNEALGDLPSFVSSIVKRLSLFPNMKAAEDIVNQLTVNEYKPGVGLAPHIDTHSAFEENIFSLSLASSCIMEFRKYPNDLVPPLASTATNFDGEYCNRCSNFERKSIYLPPRSILLMSGEGRYAWHHYIPHHKVDVVDGHVIKRGPRRISFTFRKVRRGPCCCEYAEYCDSQRKISASGGQ